MRRKFSVLFVVSMILVISFLFSACGENNNESNVEGNVDKSAEQTVENEEKSGNEEEGENKEKGGDSKVLRLTTTTSVNDSGLMEYLREPLLEETGIEMEIVSKGSGAAIEDGKMGNADLLLVHSPKAEEEFVNEGYGLERKSFMHNYFVIVGPAEDPAGIKGLSAEEAFKKINETGNIFVSRGDDSGTHKKELSIWEKAGINVDDIRGNDSYLELGDGMGAVLKFTSEKQGYTLTDLSTFLALKKDLDLEVLVDKSDALKNVYSIIIVNPDKVDGVNKELAQEFQDWMTKEETGKIIEEFGKQEHGQSLFIFGE